MSIYSRRRAFCRGGSYVHSASAFALASILIAAAGQSAAAEPSLAAAEPAPAASPALPDAIVVTGSRRATRSPTDLPAPVDIIGADELKQQASPDIATDLRVLVPSINVNDNPISGTSAGIRPVELRGLSPDSTLVMINGKRMNRSADIPTFSGGISDGSQSPDISVIPAIALKQVQVLRDGAAAQYGSDAIAGVVNFIMNDAPTGGTIQAQVGSTYAGDGNTYQIAGTYGAKLGEAGFIRGSVEYSSNDRAIRAVQRSDAAALTAEGFQDVPDPATRFGTPQIRNNIKAFVNMAIDNGFGGKFYAFGGYSRRTTSVDFFYRPANDRDGVYTDGSGNYLVGDMTPGDGNTCPGTGSDKIAVGSADAAARLAQVEANPNCFTALSKHPGGYTPYFVNHVTDIYGTIGTRGEIIDDLKYDLSVGASRYKMKINVKNSLNPSLGTDSPTDFSNGSRVQSEIVANADLSYPLDIGFATPLNIAVGSEWHKEKFQVVAGDPTSYEAGVLADQGFQIGEDAYSGYTPEEAGTWSRSNYSLYLDLETNPIEALDLGAAVRYENFTDFGGKATYKFSGLYHVTDSIGIRSTYATGFHAPSPGQQNYTGLSQELTSDGSLVNAGIIPATNPIAQTVGAKALRPETSRSISAGIVFSRPWLNLTIDYFNIHMKHRLTQSATYELTDAQRATLVGEGYAFANQIGSFQFYTNDFASRTQGVDVVATVPLHLLPTGRTSFSLAANYTKNKVLGYDPTDPGELLSQTRVVQLEDNLPRYRGNATLSHTDEKWHALFRLNYYGKYTELHVNSISFPIYAHSEVTGDFEVGYKLAPQLDLSIGANDFWNKYPTKNPYRYIFGSEYPTTSPMGIAGGSYYARLAFDF
ncbi:MAG TPA: TonB-dependent receptor [Sphingomonas sp.]